MSGTDSAGANAGQPAQNVDLVFEGGGVKGIALVGALAALEEQGYRVQNRAGTSAGAIVAALHAAGYTSAEMHDILAKLNFRDFQQEGWEDRIPLVGRAASLLLEQGIYEGDYFLKWMSDHLKKKKVETFRDLIHEEFKQSPEFADLRYKYKVQVIASDLTGRCLLVLPRDADKLGIANPDDLNVALAVRMSMSIPIFFEPVRFRNAKTGKEHTIVDGGLLSNFPVWLFDSGGVPAWPTFGLRLVEPAPTQTSLADRLPKPTPTPNRIEALVDYLRSIVATATEAHDRMYLEKATFARTIEISTLGVGSTDFDLSQEKAEDLYNSGRGAARKFLETWNFDEYIAAFREGKKLPGRREAVVQMMKAAAADAGRTSPAAGRRSTKSGRSRKVKASSAPAG